MRGVVIGVLAMAAFGCRSGARQGAGGQLVTVGRHTPGRELAGTVGDFAWRLRQDPATGQRSAELRRGDAVLASLVVAPDGGRTWAPEGLVKRVRVGEAAAGDAIRTVSRSLDRLAGADIDEVLRVTWLELDDGVAGQDPDKRAPGAARVYVLRGDDAEARTVCSGKTLDALLQCAEDGQEFAVVPAADGRLEVRPQPDVACYGACGPGCRGQCVEVAVACQPPPQGQDSAPAHGCFTVPAGVARPLPKRDFRRACAVGDQVVGKLVACSSAPCCFSHDECNRRDGGWQWLSCQVWGLEHCGFGAVLGSPKQPTTVKWFDRGRRPVAATDGAALGACTFAADGTPTWTPPPVIPHAAEQVTCPVHNQMH